MAIKGIVFNTDMVRAILDGRKTVTRRVIRPQPDDDFMKKQDKALIAAACAPYQSGDILYVREKWQYAYDMDGNDQFIEGTGRYLYYVENPMPFNDWIDLDTGEHKDHMPWKPSIHMPKEAARIWLKVTDVRVERLKDMTENDVIKEGIGFDKEHIEVLGGHYDIPYSFEWDSTIKKKDLPLYGWDASPWVWVIEFERTVKPECI